MDYTVHEILQARILEWVAFHFSGVSSKSRNQTQVSHFTGGFFSCWATREKFIALKSYLRKSRKISNDLNVHLKQLQKEEQSLKLVLIEGWGFPCISPGKESACNVGDPGSIPGLGRSPGEGKGYPFQYSGLENFIDCTVHGITKSWTWLSDLHFHFSQILVGRWLQEKPIPLGDLDHQPHAIQASRSWITKNSFYFWYNFKFYFLS